jgi:hypothetical protein
MKSAAVIPRQLLPRKAVDLGRLSNNGQVFTRICLASEAAHRYLEKAYSRRRAVYVAIGIETLLDVELQQLLVESGERGGEVTVPTDLITTAATGAPVPLGNIIDLGIKTKWENRNESVISCFAEGEQVYAVQYRKVAFRWFSGGSVVEEAELKGTAIWKSFWTRSAGTRDEADIDSLAVSLESNLEKADVGSDSDIFQNDEEEIIFKHCDEC